MDGEQVLKTLSDKLVGVLVIAEGLGIYVPWQELDFAEDLKLYRSGTVYMGTGLFDVGYGVSWQVVENPTEHRPVIAWVFVEEGYSLDRETEARLENALRDAGIFANDE